MKGMYEVWREGSSYEELEEAIRSYPEDQLLPYLSSDTTFKITVDSFGKVFSFQEQNDRIKGLSYIPFKVRCFASYHLLIVCFNEAIMLVTYSNTIFPFFAIGDI